MGGKLIVLDGRRALWARVVIAVMALVAVMAGQIVAVSGAAYAASAPGAPTGLTGTGGVSQVGLRWKAPTSTGGAAISDYIVQYRLSSVSSWSTFADGTSTTLAATVTGLTNGSAYTFQVAAKNSAGTGAYSSTVSATPAATAPGAPTGVGVVSGAGQLNVSWTAPASSGGTAISDYVIQYKLVSASSWTTFADGTSTSTSAVVKPLTNGSSYDVRVAAVNSSGTSAYSSTATGTPQAAAGAPTALALTPGAGQMGASWKAPADNGGAAITDYSLQYRASGVSSWSTFTHTASTATQATVTGLSNGTAYDVRVAAVTSVGTGTYTATATATPQTTPDTPTGLNLAGGNGTLDVTWSAPTGTGGSAITDYVVQYKLASASSWSTFTHDPSTTLKAKLTGLTNGSSYTVRVAAVNAQGTGAYSTSATGAPAAMIPDAPAALAADAGPSRLTLSWTAPASDGGSAISDYAVQYKLSSASTWTTFTHTASTSPKATITSLVNGSSYDVRVAAVNSVGTGSYSATVSAAPHAAAGQVVRSTVTISPAAVSTFAGSGAQGTDDGTASTAMLNNPYGLRIVGAFGYFFDNNRLRKIDMASGAVTTISATDSTTCADSSNPTQAMGPGGQLVDDGAFLYWVSLCGNDPSHSMLRSMDLASGAVTKVSDAPYATAVTVGPGGTLYVAAGPTPDSGTSALLQKVDTVSQTLSTVASINALDGMSAARIGALTSDATRLWATVASSTSSSDARVIQIDPSTGTTTLLAGSVRSNTNTALSGDTLLSAGDYLYATSGVFSDSSQNGSRNVQVARLTKSNGAWTIIAGMDLQGYRDSTGAAALFGTLSSIDTDGNALYVTDAGDHRIRKLVQGTALPVTTPTRPNLSVSPAKVSTFAGSGTQGSDDGSSSNATLSSPLGLHVVDGYGYFFDAGRLRKVNMSTGAITTVWTRSANVLCDDSQDPATASGSLAKGQMTDDGTFLYWVSDCYQRDTWWNPTIFRTLVRRMDLSTGTVSTVAAVPGATAVTMGPGNVLYVASQPSGSTKTLLQKIDTVNQTLTTVTTIQPIDGMSGALLDAMTSDATSLWATVSSSSGSTDVRVIKIDPSTWATTVLAGSARQDTTAALTGDTLVSAGDYLYASSGIFSDSSRNGDRNVQVARLSKSDGSWSTIAGTDVHGYRDANGSTALFGKITGLDVDGSAIYAVDSGNYRIRKLVQGNALPVTTPTRANLSISPAKVTTFAGSGTQGSDDGSSSNATLSNPLGLHVVDGFGYFFDAGRLRKVNMSTGAVTTVWTRAANVLCDDSQDPATASGSLAKGQMSDDGAFLYWVSDCYQRDTSWNPTVFKTLVRRMNLDTGTVSTVAAVPGATALTMGPGNLLYVASQPSGSTNTLLQKIDTVNQTLTTVATIQPLNGMSGARIGALTSDATSLWASIASSAGSSDARVIKIAPTTGAATVLLGSIRNDTSAALTGDTLVSAGDYLYGSSGIFSESTRNGYSNVQIARLAKTDGTWSTIAGTDLQGYRDDTGASALLGTITGIDVTDDGIYVTDASSRVIRKLAQGTPLPSNPPARDSASVSPAAISSFAGSDSGDLADGTGTDAGMNQPAGLHIVDGYGYFFANNRMRKIRMSTGAVTTVWTGNTSLRCDDTVNPATATGSLLTGQITDDGSFLYWVSDCYQNDTWNNPTLLRTLVRRMNLSTGTVSTLAAVPNATAVTVGPDGAVYVASSPTGSSNALLQRIDPINQIPVTLTTIAPPTGMSDTRVYALAGDSTGLWAGITSLNGKQAILKIDAANGGTTTFYTGYTTGADTSALVVAGSYLYGQYAWQNVSYHAETGNVGVSTVNGLGRWNKTTGDFTRILAPTGADLAIPVPGGTSSTTPLQINGLDADGSNLYLSSKSGTRIFKLRYTPPLPPTPAQAVGGSNPSVNTDCSCSVGSPVDLDTGAQWDTTTDLLIPGRGIPLQLARTYDTRRATTNGRMGYGWNDSYNWKLTVDTSNGPQAGWVAIRQDNGSEATFLPPAGNAPLGTNGLPTGPYTSAPGVLSTLVRNSDGTWTLTIDQRTTYTFDDGGRLTAITDLNGYRTALAYDSSGRLTTVTDPAGRTLTYTYDASNRIQTITDPANRVLTYTYDSAGNLASVTNLAGGHWTMAYDSAHLLTGMTDPRGNTTTTVYTDGKVSAQTDRRGKTTTFDYGTTNANGDHITTITRPTGTKDSYTYESGRRTATTRAAGTPDASTQTFTYDPATNAMASVTDNAGNTTTYTYDERGNQTSATDALGHVTRTTYNALNLPLAVTDASGFTTTSTYDSAGRLLSVSRPLTGTSGGSAGSTVISSTYTYGDSAHPGDLTSTTDADGKTTTFTYDADGDQATVTDPSGRTTTTTHNTVGWQTSVTTPGGHTITYSNFTTGGQPGTVTDALGHQTRYLYDNNGNTTDVTDAENRQTTTTYNENDQPTQVTLNGAIQSTATYDGDGNQVTSTDALGHTTTTTYDGLNRPTATTDALSHSTHYGYNTAGDQTTVTDASGHTTTTTYDADHQAVRVTTPENRTVTSTYDALGRVTASTDAANRVTATSYDSLGRRTQTAEGTTAQQQSGTLSVTQKWTYDHVGNILTSTDGVKGTTTYTRDDAGRATTVTDPLGRVTSLTYDADGNQITTTKPDHSVTTTSYDADGQVTGIDYPTGTPDVGYTYDATGRRVSMSDDTGTTSYTYNTRGQLTGTIHGTGPSATTLTYTYDAAGRRTTVIYPGTGHTLTYGYDDADRMTSVTDWANRTTTYTYNINDTLKATALPNGVTTSYGYDASGLTTAITSTSNTGGTSSSPSMVVDLRYTYDNTGLLTDTRDVTDPANPVDHAYTWDSRSRLSAITSASSSPGTGTITFDAANRLTTNLGTSYTLDAAGQLTTSTTPATGTTAASSGTYTYNDLGQRTKTVTTTGSTSTTKTYGYNADDKLTSYTDTAVAGLSLAYTYDGDGLRASKTRTAAAQTTTSTYLWDTSASLPLMLEDGDSYYLYGNASSPYAQISTTTGAITYLQADVNGSTVATTDATGTRTGTWTYDPYGAITRSTGVGQTPFKYAGEYRDTDTGFTYLRARDYDPATGSLLTRDPLEQITNSPYGYVSGNPLQYGDPTGLCNWWLWQCGGAMSDLGKSAATSAVNVGRGATGGLTDDIANFISPGASCTVDSSSAWARVAYGSGLAGSLLTGAGEKAILGRSGSEIAKPAVSWSERAFTNRWIGVDSPALGHKFARGAPGFLNRPGSRLKLGWSAGPNKGGGWEIRIGVGVNPEKPNQALYHGHIPAIHVPNNVANPILSTIRTLRGL
ncbi:fibronectin type III domain-containing protein [Kineosporia sp. J2-2]|uniref:Fibronectin type III domain-containing protein n=1 Tax=Kineosporia corallincola TaxID=2835133 RepID=A0ABS5TTT9_9ACTN|nr:fibronectin type III domain-containing protein [Kineosporia corallincola]